MSDVSILLEKLTPNVGGVVHGVDLSRPLDESTFKQVHDALIDNGVIFFRDQHLTPEQQKAFGRRFGELHIHPAAPKELPEHPEILVIHADEVCRHPGELPVDQDVRNILLLDAAQRVLGAARGSDDQCIHATRQ